ncbi:MAG: XTP/dITP diphosphatase [Lachnospiraceae bacterium]|nr:XTP/dITP diphosphatase [Lachnospiraceae bacterium]
MARIVFATGNKGKLKEIRSIMADLNMEIVSMKEAGVDPEIVEDGKTFKENAFIKAREVAKLLKDDIVMADDSGLVIDALNGEPGIYSARYLGEDTPYSVKNADLIKRLEGVENKDRTARFVCVVACVFPDKTEAFGEGVIEGRIGYEERGENGFGYDPIFYLPDKDVTTAELSEEDKNAISHRGNALRAVKDHVLRWSRENS